MFSFKTLVHQWDLYFLEQHFQKLDERPEEGFLVKSILRIID